MMIFFPFINITKNIYIPHQSQHLLKFLCH